ncbi:MULTISPECIES: LuxR family transcriptional regulator [unclassified Pseudonocardia]|uniref:AAA family ATPase n=1 Tax=unclassified Pseudonocardia TaxID=2619320 RepID=UPI00094AD6F6|nr:LuxR family transcriptional regulator [Pseudonocardia sp. Ae707_Ps1]OLM17413.1 regulatory protein, LuxR [Pseudonocardia sp. Ae707_Ps1]
MELFGRRAETAALDRVLARAAGGEGSGLVLWGEPGIGKTALLDHAVGAASGATVLRCRGTRMEAGLAFAALHELLWPVTDRLDALPAPQAAALRGALGLSRDPANRFLIGAAVLSLLSGLARERPVLVVVDDAQWIDEATVHCLGFVARRVRTDPVVVLLTGHEDPASGPWEGLPSMEVVGLADDDARRLVAAVVPDTDETLVDRTVRTAGGNPLALRELPTLGREAPLPAAGEPVAVGPRLRRAFCARVETLKPSARALLLLAAAEDRGDRHVVHRAGAGWGVDTDAWDEALRSGLLRASGARVEFRHPLVRAAVYDGAPFADRQAAHRALAAVLSGDALEERAWHLAAAAEEADEDVAALLERAADRCLQRSAGPMASRTLRRAAELSPEPADAARRLAAAARAAWDAGQAGAARRLLDDAELLDGVDPVVRRSGGLRGILEFAYGRPERAHHYLARDMTVVPGTRGAVELGSMAVRAAWSAGRPELQQEALRRLLDLDAGGDPELSPVVPVLRAWWACYDETGQVARATPGRSSDTVGRLGTVPWELLPPVPLVWAWGAEGPLHDVLTVQAAQLRRRHELAALAMVLSQTAVLDLAAGRWEAAGSAAEEGLQLAAEVGADHIATQCRLSLAGLAAARGDGTRTEELTRSALTLSVPRGVRALTASAYWHRGRAALLGGRPQEALRHLLPLDEPGHEAAHRTAALLAAPDTAEAAAQAGRADVVGARVATVATWAERTGAVWARSAAHRLRALTADGPAAETSYRAALDEAGACDDPFEHARTRLLYGEWLRRARRRADARHELAAAADTFGRLGAEPLRARALREQDLAGGPGARHEPGSPAGAGLTAQELRVARLAADGLTNREIAAQLLISHRTVGHHLASVYPKLGITSRVELARIDMAGDLRFRVGADEG